jgi:glutamate:GABA antiporter
MAAHVSASATRQKLVSEIVPDQVLPKVLGTFDLIAVYIFIIFFIAGSSIIAGGGWDSISMWLVGFAVFLVPAAMAVGELGGLWPSQGGVYIWAYHTMTEPLAFLGGFLSWIPVILNGTLIPALAIAGVSYAFDWQPGLTLNIICQLVLLWGCVAFAMRKLTLSQAVARAVLIFYSFVVVAVLIAGIIVASRNGAAAVPYRSADAFSFNFGKSGWVFGVVLLYLLGVETPYNMGAEFLRPRSAIKMVLVGSIVLAIGYLFGTVGILLSTPADELNAITGVPRVFDYLNVSGLGPAVAVAIALISLMAFTIYQSAYSRLVFVSGLERHLPRLFTHLNPRTRNPITALLLQGAISSVLVVILYSQQSLTTIFLSLQGALTILWLGSGFFFLIPLVLARYRYADRYETEDFWRIPGGRGAAIAVSFVGIAGTVAGIYYTFTLPFSPDIPKRTWMLNVGTITAGVLVAAAVIYVAGRRSAAKVNEDERLVHLTQLNLNQA